MKDINKKREERNKRIDKTLKTLETINDALDPIYRFQCIFKGLLIFVVFGFGICITTFALLQHLQFIGYVVLVEAIAIIFSYFYLLHAFLSTPTVETKMKNCILYGKEDVAISYEVKRCLSKYRTAQLFIGGALSGGVKSYNVKITYKDEQGNVKTIKHIYSFLRRSAPDFRTIMELPIKINNGIAHIDVQKLEVEVWL